MKRYLLIILFLGSMVSCKKDWLEAKPDAALVVPTTIQDLQALLNNTESPFNGRPTFNVSQDPIQEICSGDFIVKDITYNSLSSPTDRNAYIWGNDIYDNAQDHEGSWNLPYKRIFYTNIVIEGLEKIKPKNNTEQIAWNTAKGSALFLRAYSYFNIAELYTKAYSPTTLNEPSIPLRLNADFNEKSVRSTVGQTYAQIIQDLKAAADILVNELPNSSLNKYQPTNTAAYAMLARVYLAMEDYENAWFYANESLKRYNVLMDYKLLTALNTNTPFAKLNPEVIFQITLGDKSIFRTSRLIISQELHQSYHTDDLRLTGFFSKVAGEQTFKGSYDAGIRFFSGLATDELYLIRAEAYARKGKVTEAMQDLNTLMEKRWKAGFVPITATDAEDALRKILLERRKELCFRGIRFSDLKRLNRDPRFKVVLSRTVNGTTYTLPPDDPRYVLLLFPPNVINLTGMPQTVR